MHSDSKSIRALKYKTPVESVADALPTTLARTGWSLVAATLIALLLGSKALLSWANELPIGRLSDFILYLSQGWDNEMRRLGVTHFAAAVRDFLHHFQHWR